MSTKVLVTLVSEQTIPNLLIPLEKGPFDKYIFITTEKVNKENIPNNIIEAVKEMYPSRQSSFIKSEEVNEKSIKDVWNKIDSEIKKINYSDIDFIFNFTNGTKQMSIALYSYAKTKYPNSDLLYSNRDSLTYINYKYDEEKEEKYTKFLTLSNCLTALGKKLNDRTNGARLKKTNYTKEMSEKIYANSTNIMNSKIMKQLLKRTRAKDKNIIQLSKEEYDEVNKFGFNINKYILTDIQRQYISGGWLEEYIYFHLPINIESNKSSVEFLTNGYLSQEFDLLLVKNNKVYIFECKTSIANDKIQNVSYKSSALAKKFGSESVSLIVYPHTINTETLKKLKYRAKIEGIKTIPANRIKDFEVYLMEQEAKDKEIKNRIESSYLRETARIIIKNK